MILEGHIICWNERTVAPHVMEYWQAAKVDRLIIHDNCSDDGVIDYLKRFPFVQIEPYNSAGTLDDYKIRDLKNNCWKGSDADWVFVGDFDEVPYHRNLKHLLALSMQHPIIQACGYMSLAWQFPHHLEGILVHEMPDVRLLPLGANKTHFIQPALITDMNYELGAHNCHPNGASPFYMPEISWFHLKDLGVEYLVQRNRTLYARLSAQVKQEKRIAIHYLPGSDYENVARTMASEWQDAHSWEYWSGDAGFKTKEWPDKLRYR